MLEKIITRLVEYQISRGILEEKDKRLYQYGYQVLAEYAANLLTAVLIAAVFHAYGIVLIFTLSFMLVRSYAGGYHAGTGLGCLILSALMQIAVILMVRALGSAEFMNPEIFGTEVIMVFYIWNRRKNGEISESFGKNMAFDHTSHVLFKLHFYNTDRMDGDKPHVFRDGDHSFVNGILMGHNDCFERADKRRRLK